MHSRILDYVITSYSIHYTKLYEMNPNASRITGVICGHRVEDIEDDVLRKVRYMDKLVDELARNNFV